MKFGETPVRETEGAILAHGVTVGSARFKKGRIISAEDIGVLEQAGIGSIVVARLEADDVGEDEAAARIAGALSGTNLSASRAFTGRVNLYAEVHGLAAYEREQLDRLNSVDESMTIAALPPYEPVEPGKMVATVKIIPFAVPAETLRECLDRIDFRLRVAPFDAGKVGLVQTMLPGTRDKVLDKTLDVVGRRIEGVAGTLAGDRRCRHAVGDVADAILEWQRSGCSMVLVSGASAITDRRDIVPAAIEAAGGEVEHFGMPVDPGNLMLVGRVGDTPVLGLPGCARSPKLNGFDWVLQRLAAGLPIASRDIMVMGAGGLLTEIETRPLPRAEAAPPRGQRSRTGRPRIGAVILAAGQSRRMGESNKLLADMGGKPMVAHVADAALGSRAHPVVAVLGHQANDVRNALADRDLSFVENPSYRDGLSESLKVGLRALPADVDGALICLGDMPRVSAAEIDRLIEAFNPLEGRAICVPTYRGKRGNPVLFARRFFGRMESVSGDVGARHLIGEAAEAVCEVEMDNSGILLDVDTPEQLAQTGN